MKKFITTTAMVIAATCAIAQTNATNWTAPDCNSTSHTLFNELDNGKIIVFAWVMPCGSCVGPSTTAYNVVQSFATSNPGQVLFYLADDLGDASCSTLTSWINSNSIGNTANMTIFSNSGNVISEANFGGTGMPHIVVMGGTDHKIYFNKKNSQANPVNENLSVSYTKAIKKITVTAVNGQVVKEETYATGKMNPSINISQAASGMYMIKITDIDDKTGIQKIVKQ